MEKITDKEDALGIITLPIWEIKDILVVWEKVFAAKIFMFVLRTIFLGPRMSARWEEVRPMASW